MSEAIASALNVWGTEVFANRLSMRPASVVVAGLVIALVVSTGASMDPAGAIQVYILFGSSLDSKHYLSQFILAPLMGAALGAFAARVTLRHIWTAGPSEKAEDNDDPDHHTRSGATYGQTASVAYSSPSAARRRHSRDGS